jgi:hypothetical protein
VQAPPRLGTCDHEHFFFSNPVARWLSRRAFGSWATGLALAAACGTVTAGGNPYGYYVTGNAQAPITMPTPSFVLMGGDPDVDHSTTGNQSVQNDRSAVYFVRPLNPPTVYASGQPLTMTTVEIRKLSGFDNDFDLSNWTGGTGYFVDAISGALTSTPY